MNSNSGGSVPKRTGKRRNFEFYSLSNMNKKLGEALKRLGEPDRTYRTTRDRIIRRKKKNEPD
jgi:hypothetical protein